MVKVKFLANLAIFMGRSEMDIPLDEGKKYTVRDLIEIITEKTGKDLKSKTLGEKRVALGAVRILINGRDINSLNRFDTELKDSDEVAMFPALGAG
ncbi:MAG: MoaD/ThiS family protein [Candidatus Odinarchaeia archaeon]